MHRTLKYFCQSRMRVDYTFKFFKCRLSCDQSTCFLYDVRGMRSIKMTSQQFTIFLRNDKFAETISLTHSNSLSVCTEERFMYFDWNTSLFAFIPVLPTDAASGDVNTAAGITDRSISFVSPIIWSRATIP